MNSTPDNADWTKKGATLSDKTAQKEFGLTFQEIVEGINSGKLQYREISIYGNPAIRLIRRELEALVGEKYGVDYLEQKQFKKELADVKKTLIVLKSQVQTLEKRKAELLELLKNQ
jgi:hypothetical protein